MTTAQKRGFRFPWGGDPGRDADPSEPSDDEPSLAERLGTAPDDLGRGPFDLHATDAEDDQVATAAAPEDDVAATEPAGALAPADAAADPVEARAAAAIEVAEAGTTEPDPATDVAQESAAPVAPAPDRAAWPESDRRSAAQAAALEPPRAPARPAGKANALVAGLVRAMRDAAKVARDEAVSSLRTEAATRTEAVRSDGATAVATLRKTADADVAAIREWSKAEMARIREETEARIGARKDQLVTETDEQARATEATLASLAEAVSAYESEAAAFFDRLLAEEDPARLAGLAERMPAPPTLDAFGGPAMASVDAPSPVEAPSPAAAPGKRSAPSQPAEGPDPAAEAEPIVDALVEPDALDADSAAAAEAAALAGLDEQTQLIVSGLSGVASIAAFKGALMQTAGVSAVSVNAGNDGDCVFTVTHAGDTDLRVGLREMDTFRTRLIADDGSTLVVVAHEPEA